MKEREVPIMKRILSVFLMLMLLLGLTTTPGYAAQTTEDSACADATVQAQQAPPEAPYATGYIQEEQVGARSLTDAYLEEEAIDVRASSLPSKYDGRSYGYLTPVRSQRPYAACWAYASIAALEAYVVKHGVVDPVTGLPATTELDLSETHLAWFSYTQAYDKLGMLVNDQTVRKGTSVSGYPNYMMGGGNSAHAALTMLRWDGAASELVTGLSKAELPQDGIDASLAWKYDSVHVQAAEKIPCANRDAVKQAIMEYGACAVPICVPNNAIGESFKVATSSVALYCSSGSTNHAVALVGWDNNYAVSNFPADSRPSKPGAWICKNSWDDYWGEGGYFYLSYEDVPSSQSECWFIAAESADNYDNIYQYDGTACTKTSSIPSGGKVANRFAANGNELLEAVSIGTCDEAVSYTLQIFTDLTNEADPTSGTLQTTQSGAFPFGGFHTVRLNQPVSLSSGQSYAVVFQLSVSNSSSVSMYIDTSSDAGWYSSVHFTPANTSFYTKKSGGWTVNETSNYRIKAYTSDVTPQEEVPLQYYVQGKLMQTLTGRDGHLVKTPKNVATPTGYEFVGWTTEPYSYCSSCPSFCAPGDLVSLDPENPALYALFRKETAYSLVTAAPKNWDGKYVLTTASTASGQVLTGLTLNGTNIAGDDLSTAFAQTGIVCNGKLLTNVDPLYVFEFSKQDTGWSIQNRKTETWLSSLSGYLALASAYSSASGAWTPTMNGKNFVLRITGKDLYVSINKRGYLAVNTTPDKPIYLWKLVECYTTFSDDWDPSSGDCVSSLFSDVPAKGNVVHNAIEWAYVNGITGGTDATHFSPNKTVMRSDAMVFFWAAEKRPSYKDGTSPFTDVKKKHWYYDAVMWAVENKITGGTDATHFSPSQTCSRSEILQFLYAAMNKPTYTISNPYSDVKSKYWYSDGAIWAYENGLEKGENGKFNAKTPCTRGSVVTYLYRFITGNELVS